MTTNWKLCLMFIASTMLFAFNQKDIEKEFILNASLSNNYAVAIAKLASEKSGDQEIKSFADMVMKDHQKIIAELEALATVEGVTLKDELNAEQQKKWTTLNKLNGVEFNQAYQADAIASQENALVLFHKASTAATIQDAALKKWIVSKLPLLKAHLNKAKMIG